MLNRINFQWILIYIFLILKFIIAYNIESIDDDFKYPSYKIKFQQKRQNKAHNISITFPGTRWCGPGNTANGYEDLGKFKETDKCCRDHDHCDNIPAGEEKYGLKNNDWFTRYFSYFSFLNKSQFFNG